MKIKLIRSYRSKKGNPTFVYGITGSAEELEAYKVAQGTFYREDDATGQPLWFTTRCVGDSGELIITTNGKVVPDMSKYDQAASLASQYGGNFGEQLAKLTAQSILGHSAPAPEATPAPVAQAPVVEDAPSVDDAE